MPSVFQQALPAQPPIDAYTQLMQEYARLQNQQPAGPMYSPDEIRERIRRNNEQVNLGALGALSGDPHVSQVGSTIFKQALGDRGERITQRGIMDPLTGVTAEDPEYQNERHDARRGKILDAALRFEDQRQRAAERATAAEENRAFRRDMQKDQQEFRRQIRESGGQGGHNLQQVTDPTTGEMWWHDPRTGDPVKPITNPNAGAPMVKPDKMTAADEKSVTEMRAQSAAVQSALQAVQASPSAFSVGKGIPDMGSGVLSRSMAAYRDRKMSEQELAARSMVYNNVSTIIKERAGTAQSVSEQQRLNSFLPSPIDGPREVGVKLKAFQQYLGEQETTTLQKYRGGARPVTRVPGSGQGASYISPTPQAPGAPAATPAPAPAAPGGGLSPAEQAELDALRARFGGR